VAQGAALIDARFTVGDLRRWSPAAIALALVVALVGFVAALPQPGERAVAPTAGFAVIDARVFDGDRVMTRATVLVRDGRIEAVGPEIALPAGIERVDGRGRTLLPGLIDAHVHTYGDALASALNFGVTTVIDMFCDPATLRELRPTRESMAPREHADLYSAGWLATVAGGHGTQFGLPVPTLEAPGEARAWVDARLAEGSDFVKIVYEPKDESGKGPPFASLDLPTVTALVDAAHARGVLAVVHVSRLEPARDALAAGADGLVHVNSDRPVDAALVELAFERGAFVTPTLAVIAAFDGHAAPHARTEAARFVADPAVGPYLTPPQRRSLTDGPAIELEVFRLDAAVESVRALHAAGVEILAGSDAPNPGTVPGASLHRELELLVRAGLAPIEALRAATAAPARRYGLDDRGRIAPGLRADLLLVDGDPTVDIRDTRRIARTWKSGAAVERRRYPEEP
jgi:imidazolonepropionase-like amidohydrolase